MPVKPTVAVLMGGPSGEHEISLMSGQAVCDALESEGYKVRRIVIDRTGDWRYGGSEPVSPEAALSVLRTDADVVFPALHGTFGEDGTIQALLDSIGVCYVGSGVAASALAMDKIHSRRIAAALGCRVAPAVEVGGGWCGDAIQKLIGAAAELTLPLFVKPATSGSSVGMSRITELDDLESAVHAALEYGGRVVVESAVHGRELSCPVLGDAFRGARALPVIEIVPRSSDFFDYEAKYTEGLTDEVCPARIDQETAARVSALAVRLHDEFGCRSLSRSDFILTEQGEPYFLELNTLPGLTPVSLFPKAAIADGMTYEGFCSILVEGALAGASRGP